MLMQLMGTTRYPFRMFSDCMDDFMMDEKTSKTTPVVATDDFYKSIQKLYDRAILSSQLEGMYVEN